MPARECRATKRRQMFERHETLGYNALRKCGSAQAPEQPYGPVPQLPQNERGQMPPGGKERRTV